VNGIRTGKVFNLSEQHVVDCCTEDQGCFGCAGGDTVWTTRDFFAVVGTFDDNDYPYTSGSTGTAGASCLSSSKTAFNTADVNVTGVRFATNDNESSRADFIKALLD
jgi:hypothetical protein